MVGLQNCGFHDWYSYPVAGPLFNKSNDLHEILPGLLWDDEKQVSLKIVWEVEYNGWRNVCDAREWDEVLISQIRKFDFRYIQTDGLGFNWLQFLNRLWETVRFESHCSFLCSPY